MKYQEIFIVASLSRNNGSGYYEVAVTDHNGDCKSSKKLLFSDCRKNGLIKRYDHTKKLIEFLNTDEGNQWFDENSKDFA